MTIIVKIIIIIVFKQNNKNINTIFIIKMLESIKINKRYYVDVSPLMLIGTQQKHVMRNIISTKLINLSRNIVAKRVTS